MMSLGLRARVILLCGLLGVVLFAIPFVASADTFQFSGRGADASFFSFNESDGSSTSVFVFMGDFRNRFHDPPGRPQASSEKQVSVFISQFFPGDPDDPSDDVFRDIFGFASGVDVTVNRSLTSATLNAPKVPATVCEFTPSQQTCTETTLAVDLSWTGGGELVRESSNFHFKGNGFVVNGHFQGTRRTAEVTGSITDGVTEFTGDSVGFGSIFDAKQGQVFID